MKFEEFVRQLGMRGLSSETEIIRSLQEALRFEFKKISLSLRNKFY